MSRGSGIRKLAWLRATISVKPLFNVILSGLIRVLLLELMLLPLFQAG